MVYKTVFLIGGDNGKIIINQRNGENFTHAVDFYAPIGSYRKMDSIFPCFHKNKIYIFIPGNYVIYDGTSYSEPIPITGFNRDTQQILAAQNFDNKIVVIARRHVNTNVEKYEASILENGIWSEFKELPIDNPHTSNNTNPEQISSVSTGKEARVFFALNRLIYLSSANDFQSPFSILIDNDPIHPDGPPFNFCAVSSEISAVDYIFAAPIFDERRKIGVFLQDGRFSVRKLFGLDYPASLNDDEAVSLDIYRQSKDLAFLRCSIARSSGFTSYYLKFNIKDLEIGYWKIIPNFATSPPKFITAWPAISSET